MVTDADRQFAVDLKRRNEEAARAAAEKKAAEAARKKAEAEERVKRDPWEGYPYMDEFEYIDSNDLTFENKTCILILN